MGWKNTLIGQKAVVYLDEAPRISHGKDGSKFFLEDLVVENISLGFSQALMGHFSSFQKSTKMELCAISNGDSRARSMYW